MTKTKAFITGILCGSAVAGIAALLTAPSSGTELRRKLKEKSEDFKRSLTDLKDDTKLLTEQIAGTAAEGKDVFIELKGDVQKAFSSWKHETNPHRENIQREIEELQQSIDYLQQSVPNKN